MIFFALVSPLELAVVRFTVVKVVKLDLLLFNLIIPAHNDCCGSFALFIFMSLLFLKSLIALRSFSL